MPAEAVRRQRSLRLEEGGQLSGVAGLPRSPQERRKFKDSGWSPQAWHWGGDEQTLWATSDGLTRRGTLLM